MYKRIINKLKNRDCKSLSVHCTISFPGNICIIRYLLYRIPYLLRDVTSYYSCNVQMNLPATFMRLTRHRLVLLTAATLLAGFSALYALDVLRVSVSLERFALVLQPPLPTAELFGETASSESRELRACVAKVLSSRISRAHLDTLLSLLDDVAAALEAARVTYFMSDGTLLGSWRHHGLIPWDDDVDLWFDGAHKARALRALSRVPDAHLFPDRGGLVKLARPVPGCLPTGTTAPPALPTTDSPSAPLPIRSVSNQNQNPATHSLPTSPSTPALSSLHTAAAATTHSTGNVTPSSSASQVWWPHLHEQLARFGPGFWPSGCTASYAEVDLFWFDDTLTGVRPTIHWHIAILRAAIFPLVRRPFERLQRVSTSSSNSTSTSTSGAGPGVEVEGREQLSRELETWRAAPYRLLPAPRDPPRVLAPIYADVERRCAKLGHWLGFGVPRCAHSTRTRATLYLPLMRRSLTFTALDVLVLVQRGLRGDVRRAAAARAVRLAPRERLARRRAAAQPARAALRVRAAKAAPALTSPFPRFPVSPFPCSSCFPVSRYAGHVTLAQCIHLQSTHRSKRAASIKHV